LEQKSEEVRGNSRALPMFKPQASDIGKNDDRDSPAKNGFLILTDKIEIALVHSHRQP